MSGQKYGRLDGVTVAEAREWLEREKRKKASPAVRFYAMQTVHTARKEAESGGGEPPSGRGGA